MLRISTTHQVDSSAISGTGKEKRLTSRLTPEETQEAWQNLQEIIDQVEQLGVDLTPEIRLGHHGDWAIFKVEGFQATITTAEEEEQYFNLETAEKMTVLPQQRKANIDFTPLGTASFREEIWSEALLLGILELSIFFKILEAPRTLEERQLAKLAPHFFEGTTNLRQAELARLALGMQFTVDLSQDEEKDAARIQTLQQSIQENKKRKNLDVTVSIAAPVEKVKQALVGRDLEALVASLIKRLKRKKTAA